MFALAAHGREVETDDKGSKLEVSGFYKSLLSGVLLQPETVTGARALAKLTGSSTSIPDGGFVSAHLFRINTKLLIREDLELLCSWQLALSLASDPALLAGNTLSSTVGGTNTSGRRRIVELGGTLGQGPTWRLDHSIDRLALKFALPFADVTVGRQVLSWGTGRVWNPTDLLSPFPPTVVDREVRRGFDAVRVAVPLGETGQLDLLYLLQQDPADMGGVARAQLNVLGWDGSISVGKYVDDLVFGADVVGDVGPIGVHAEGAYTVQLTGLKGGGPVGLGEHFFRGVISGEWKPLEHVVLMAEYSFNGYGTNDPSKLAGVLSSARVVRGEIFGGGMHQLALAGVFTVNELLTAQVSVLGNLADPSALVIPSVEYSLTPNVLLRAGAYVPLGRAPDATVFTSLGPLDVAMQSDAFRSAIASRGLKSEFGSSSFGGFAQVGVYLP
ncbi:MAG: hypothetical protein U0228_30855 [Myxococcaceae bacterium]